MYNSVSHIVEFAQRNDVPFRIDAPMSEYTTFKIGGSADILLTPADEGELCGCVRECVSTGTPYMLLGNGSDLLVSDDGIEGAVISTARLNGISLSGETDICCMAGASLASVCNFAADASLTGLEFAFGIPGSVGGAVYMNAGAYGGEIKDVAVSCRFLDKSGEIRELPASELGFGYRRSIFTDNGEIVLSAVIHLEHGDSGEIKAKMSDIIGRRRDKQPLELPSAGSAFKRPEGYFAGTLIEQCGLKGFRIGGAAVSDKHAGFIVNVGSATTSDVMMLIEHIQNVVFTQTGVSLTPEIKCVGRNIRRND